MCGSHATRGFFFSLALDFFASSWWSSRQKRRMPGAQEQRRRPMKPATIHDCALYNDLLGLRSKLEENPSLLNARSGYVSHFYVLFLALVLELAVAFDFVEI